MERVFIYGSCVTRDSVPSWTPYDWDLVGYVARQSLLSVDRPAPRRLFDLKGISSAFQRRMAEGDILGNLWERVRAAAPIDLFIWDLTDERSGVRWAPSEGVVTNVIPYSSGLFVGPGRLEPPLALGTPAHREKWALAAKRFVERAKAAGLVDRMVVNGTPWASADENGAAVSHSGLTADEFNGRIVEYYDILSSLGFRIATPSTGHVTALSDHQWGAAPFHFAPHTYEQATKAIHALHQEVEPPQV